MISLRKLALTLTMTTLISVTLFPSYVKADVQLTQEFVEPIKNWSFEDRAYGPYPGDGVYRCPPWETNNGGWRELRGDVNGDGKVDGLDKMLVGIALWSQPGDPNWNPDADIDGNGIVDGIDKIIVGLDMWKVANRIDGSYSWYTSGGGEYQMWQWLDSDAVQAVAGQTVMFSFQFYPESAASDVSQNNARAEIYYEYSGDSNTVYGPWVAPTELNWWKAYVTASLPSTITTVKVIIHGKPDFKAWIDLAQLTTVAITPPDTSTANPYSTDYELIVPNDGDAQVTYLHEIEMYIWSEWDNQYFGFKAVEVDDWVLNVKIDGILRYSGSTSDPPLQQVSVDLGPLSAGYHTLEFDFVEQWSIGNVNFYVALFGDPNLGKAALTHFHVEVPDYGDSEVRYKVKTTTHFPIHDDYFLNGYADDYIDSVYVDGLKWFDWQWSLDSEKIYAWGDGFLYPLGEYKGWYDVQFDFGEIWGGGLLDFEYISWTNQRDKIGAPKFYGIANVNTAEIAPGIPSDVTIDDARFYGGSEWKFTDTPEFSERYFETRLRINASWSSEFDYFNTRIEVGVGIGWAEWALGPGTMDDLGVMVNLTCLAFDSNMESGDQWRWDLSLIDSTLDIYSFPYVELAGVEHHPEGESIVKPDLTIAVDYIGTVIMFISTTVLPETPAIIGSLVGLGIKGIAAGAKYFAGQETDPYTIEIGTASHYQLKYKDTILTIHEPDKYLGSKNDLVFFKLDPVAGKHSGLTKVVLRGTIMATYGSSALIVLWPIADVEITLYIPWFVRG